jgi:hypothetical protein
LPWKSYNKCEGCKLCKPQERLVDSLQLAVQMRQVQINSNASSRCTSSNKPSNVATWISWYDALANHQTSI